MSELNRNAPSKKEMESAPIRAAEWTSDLSCILVTYFDRDFDQANRFALASEFLSLMAELRVARDRNIRVEISIR